MKKQENSQPQDWRKGTGLDELRKIPEEPQIRKAPKPLSRVNVPGGSKPKVVDWSEREEFPPGFRLTNKK